MFTFMNEMLGIMPKDSGLCIVSEIFFDDECLFKKVLTPYLAIIQLFTSHVEIFVV